MAQIIMLAEAQHARADAGALLTRMSRAATDALGSPAAGHLPRKEDIYRAVLLLDVAARHARLLVKEVSDPSRRTSLDEQLDTTDHLLHAAREMALKL